MPLDRAAQRLITMALEEDLGPGGDVTSSLLPVDLVGSANILAKSELIVAGSEAFAEVFDQVDPQVQVNFHMRDGERAQAGEVIGEISGSARNLLIGERTALNLMQRLCGVATMARAAQDAVAGTKAKVVRSPISRLRAEPEISPITSPAWARSPSRMWKLTCT